MLFKLLEKKIKELDCEEQDIHFQLDPFHIAQAIMRKVSDKKVQKQLLKLFRKSKIDEGLETIVNMIILTNENDNAFKKLTELYDYLFIIEND